MCDTLVAMPSETAGGAVLFGKNSDREPNEAHHLLIVPAADHPEGSMVRCTYRSIPQAAHTCAVLLAKPSWIWGAEMGTNEHGVVIGNEALFTRIPPAKGDELIGMDLLRLALERGRTAREALEVITGLLKEYSQGGNCGFTRPFYYQNSFLIADPTDAWVLETAGREWAAEHVQGIRSISNAITIQREWDEASPGLVNFALEQRWVKSREEFSFAEAYSDNLYTRFSDARKRQSCTTRLLHETKGQLTALTVMEILRTHIHNEPAGWVPYHALVGADVCMHAGYGPVRINQTTGSMVSQLTAETPVHWLTGTAAPCTSLFKPVWLDAGLPDTGPVPGKTYTPGSLWWEHERVHRGWLMDYLYWSERFTPERDALEAEFYAGAQQLQGAPVEDRRAYSEQCFRRAAELEAQWLAQIQSETRPKMARFYYLQAWKGFNALAKMPEN